MNKSIFVLFVFLLAFPLVSAQTQICSGVSGSGSDATDYRGVNTDIVNVTAMSDTQKFSAYTFFTPILNVTVNVWDVVMGNVSGSNSTLSWRITGDNFTVINASLSVYNGSFANPVLNRANFSLINTSDSVYVLKWANSVYNGSSMIVKFNRTFVKNVDDLVVAPESILVGASTSNFLTFNAPSSFGEDSTFKLNNNSVGVFLNKTNWAVGWSYNTQTCSACDVSETGLFSAIKVFLVLIGVLLLIAGFVLFRNGMIDVKGLVMFVVGTIIWFVLMPTIRNILVSYGC